ncbi:MAG: peptide deformylase [Bacillota bacterium]
MPIRFEPDEVLHRKARPVSRVSQQVRSLLDDMLQTMRAAHGQGLAAPQVGVLRRVVVVEVSPHGVMELINPEITIAGGAEVLGLEGCLSMPGLIAEVPRHERVQVTALDRNGRRFWNDAEGELARCFQHEIDHLDGILMTDRAVRLFRMKEEESLEEIPVDSE